MTVKGRIWRKETSLHPHFWGAILKVCSLSFYYPVYLSIAEKHWKNTYNILKVDTAVSVIWSKFWRAENCVEKSNKNHWNFETTNYQVRISLWATLSILHWCTPAPPRSITELLWCFYLSTMATLYYTFLIHLLSVVLKTVGTWYVMHFLLDLDKVWFRVNQYHL